MRAAYTGARPQEAPAAAVGVLETMAGIPVMLQSNDPGAMDSAARIALAAFDVNQDRMGAALQRCA